jgi:hypothetical protein
MIRLSIKTRKDTHVYIYGIKSFHFYLQSTRIYMVSNPPRFTYKAHVYIWCQILTLFTYKAHVYIWCQILPLFTYKAHVYIWYQNLRILLLILRNHWLIIAQNTEGVNCHVASKSQIGFYQDFAATPQFTPLSILCDN